jgi:hypothetical protein
MQRLYSAADSCPTVTSAAEAVSTVLNPDLVFVSLTTTVLTCRTVTVTVGVSTCIRLHVLVVAVGTVTVTVSVPFDSRRFRTTLEAVTVAVVVNVRSKDSVVLIVCLPEVRIAGYGRWRYTVSRNDSTVMFGTRYKRREGDGI